MAKAKTYTLSEKFAADVVRTVAKVKADGGSATTQPYGGSTSTDLWAVITGDDTASGSDADYTVSIYEGFAATSAIVTGAKGTNSLQGTADALSAGSTRYPVAGYYQISGVWRYVFAAPPPSEGGGTGSAVQRMRVQSVSTEYITCRSLTGTTVGTTDIKVIPVVTGHSVGDDIFAAESVNGTSQTGVSFVEILNLAPNAASAYQVIQRSAGSTKLLFDWVRAHA